MMRRHWQAGLFGTILVLLATVVTPTPPAHAQEQQCFSDTGFCVAGRFLAHWRANGGLALNGFPLTPEQRERLEDGNEYTVQYFERVRLELHPENPAPNDVLLGQFGRRIHPADPPVAPQPGETFFPETGHNVGPRFFAYWQANGALTQFGYPISEPIDERLEDGNTYRVQYFERARFEFHPENPAPNDILLGQFGRRILAGVPPVGVAPPAPGTPAPGIPPTLSAPLGVGTPVGHGW